MANKITLTEEERITKSEIRKQKAKARSQAYYIRNRDEHIAICKAYNEEHKTRILEQKKVRYAIRKENGEISAYQKEYSKRGYYEKNRDKILNYQACRNYIKSLMMIELD